MLACMSLCMSDGVHFHKCCLFCFDYIYAFLSEYLWKKVVFCVWSSYLEFTPCTRQTEPVSGHVKKTTKDVSVHETPAIEWERGWWLGGGVDWEWEGGERKREEEEKKGHTVNELCIIVLLLVLSLLCFIIFQLERQKRVQANELCIIVLLLVFKFIMFYHILFYLTWKQRCKHCSSYAAFIYLWLDIDCC